VIQLRQDIYICDSRETIQFIDVYGIEKYK